MGTKNIPDQLASVRDVLPSLLGGGEERGKGDGLNLAQAPRLCRGITGLFVGAVRRGRRCGIPVLGGTDPVEAT